MPTDFRPAAFISSAALVTAASSSGMNSRPSYSWPPSTIQTPPRTSAARSSGQSQNGGSEAEAGMPSRSAATLVRLRRCTTALMKCVVPIITPSIFLPCENAGRTEALQRIQDAGRDVLAGRRLDGAHHLAFFDQDSVGVGAAHVDADASHAENTLLKSRS